MLKEDCFFVKFGYFVAEVFYRRIPPFPAVYLISGKDKHKDCKQNLCKTETNVNRKLMWQQANL